MNVSMAPPALEVRALTKNYADGQGHLPVLQEVDLTLERGGFVALLGPSGVGKSTLLNILARLEAPDAGSCRAPGELPYPAIAYMQQKDLLLPWRSVLDNILLAPELRGGRPGRRAALPEAQAMLRDFGMEGFAHAFPATLSGGMRQRTALMRTLLCGGELLLLDEPFGALDAITRRRLQDLLLGVWRAYQHTVVLVTHDVDEALRCATRVVLLQGRPGRISGDIPIEIPHAHRDTDPALLHLKNDILEQLGAVDAPGPAEGAVTASGGLAAGGLTAERANG